MSRVLLIGWDSADWGLIHPLLDRGAMPALAALVNRGVMGRLATLHPPEPLALWTSIATGVTADRHGVLGPLTIDADSGRLRPTAGPWNAPPLWEIAAAHHRRTHVIGWPLAGRPIADEFRVQPADIPASALLELLPTAAAIDQRYDDRLAQIAAGLAECCTIHNAATAALENEPWDFAAVCYPTIGYFSRRFMQFHPPRLPRIAERDFEIYHGAVAAIYRFHDALLARLVELAGPDAAIVLVSAHGFESGTGRPLPGDLAARKPRAWFAPYGILCAAGPALRADELIHGATLLDIGPTMLALLNARGAEKMDGRVLADAFRRVPAFAAAPPPSSALAPPAARGLADHFLAFEKFDEAPRHPAESEAAATLRFHLACVYLTTGRPGQALPILETLAGTAPEDLRFERALAHCYLAVGREQDADALLSRLLAGSEKLPWMYFLMGVIRMHRGEADAALELFRQAQSGGNPPAALHAFIGSVYLAKKMWKDAEPAFQAALDADPELADAHIGMSAVRLYQKRNHDAADFALRAAAIRYDHPLAHYQLGLALARLRQYARAATALEAAVKLAPAMTRARRLLSQVRGRVRSSASHHG